MADELERRPPGRRETERRPARESVFADIDPDDDFDDGAAGVREPRWPRPSPLSDAGERPLPEPPAFVALGDPRH